MTNIQSIIQLTLGVSASLAISTISANAATISYDFESGLASAGSDAEVSAGALSENSVTAAFGSLTTTSTFAAYVPSSIANSATPSGSDYVEFTLAPAAGMALTGFGTLTADLFALVSNGSSGAMEIYAQAQTSVNGAAFTNVGSIGSASQAEITAPATHTGATLFDTNEIFQLSQGSLSVDLSSLGTLGVDETLTVRLLLGDNSGHNGALVSASNVKSIGLDNIGLSASAVPVPEPSSTALLGLGGLALILRRRK